MTVKEMMRILETLPQDHEIVRKQFDSCSDFWKTVPVRYIESSKLENKVLVD